MSENSIYIRTLLTLVLCNIFVYILSTQVVLAQTQFQSNFFTTSDGVELHYLEAGSGRHPDNEAMMADPLTPGEHEVVLRGINVWYLVRGSGPVLLIQPGGAGWGGDATIYIETLRPLEAEHTLVYYDPPGIGHSGRSDDPARYSWLSTSKTLRHCGGTSALTGSAWQATATAGLLH